jgi:hypothetical protein
LEEEAANNQKRNKKHRMNTQLVNAAKVELANGKPNGKQLLTADKVELLEEEVAKKATQKDHVSKQHKKRRKFILGGEAKLANCKQLLTTNEAKALEAAVKNAASGRNISKPKTQMAKAMRAKLANDFQPTEKELEALEVVTKKASLLLITTKHT